MKPKHCTFRTVGLILVGAALFHLIAAIMAVMLWMLIGDWRNLILQITVVAFLLTLPLGYLIWKNYFEDKFPPEI